MLSVPVDSGDTGRGQRATFPYLSMMTGSDGVSFLLPQLFLSQHRLQGCKTEREREVQRQRGVSPRDVNNTGSKISYSTEERKLDECKGKRKGLKRA